MLLHLFICLAHVKRAEKNVGTISEKLILLGLCGSLAGWSACLIFVLLWIWTWLAGSGNESHPCGTSSSFCPFHLSIYQIRNSYFPLGDKWTAGCMNSSLQKHKYHIRFNNIPPAGGLLVCAHTFPSFRCWLAVIWCWMVLLESCLTTQGSDKVWNTNVQKHHKLVKVRLCHMDVIFTISVYTVLCPKVTFVTIYGLERATCTLLWPWVILVLMWQTSLSSPQSVNVSVVVMKQVGLSDWCVWGIAASGLDQWMTAVFLKHSWWGCIQTKSGVAVNRRRVFFSDVCVFICDKFSHYKTTECLTTALSLSNHY